MVDSTFQPLSFSGDSIQVLLVPGNSALLSDLVPALEGAGIGVVLDQAEGIDGSSFGGGRSLAVVDLTHHPEEALSHLRDRACLSRALHVLVICSSAEMLTVALNAGADDAVISPIAIPELVARLRALHRRHMERPKSIVVRTADLEIDLDLRCVRRGGKLLSLTRMEMNVLEILAKNKGKSVTRSRILNKLYTDPCDTSSNIVDVYIRYLRRKIDAGWSLPLIITCRGQGYQLLDEPVIPAPYTPQGRAGNGLFAESDS